MRYAISAAVAALISCVSAAAGLGLALQAQGAFAQTPGQISVASLPRATDKALLTVTGAIATTNSPGAAVFDRDMLAALPRTTFTTSTIWTEGEVRFAGVELRSLLDRLGVTGGTLRITAINDYSVQIPAAEVVAGGALLADLRDGKPMSVRDKGPIWVVYPYDSSPDFRNEVIYSRSVWQVDRIEVLP